MRETWWYIFMERAFCCYALINQSNETNSWFGFRRCHAKKWRTSFLPLFIGPKTLASHHVNRWLPTSINTFLRHCLTRHSNVTLVTMTFPIYNNAVARSSSLLWWMSLGSSVPSKDCVKSLLTWWYTCPFVLEIEDLYLGKRSSSRIGETEFSKDP